MHNIVWGNIQENKVADEHPTDADFKKLIWTHIESFARELVELCPWVTVFTGESGSTLSIRIGVVGNPSAIVWLIFTWREHSIETCMGHFNKPEEFWDFLMQLCKTVEFEDRLVSCRPA
jgi:hypothetical protein